VPLGGRTLVERALLWLRGQGVRSVVLNLHHRPETITGVLGDGAHLGLALRYSWEPAVLGSAGGPRHALDLIDSDPFLIVNGDTLCDAPLAPMAAAHTRTGADVTMALVPNPAPGRYNGVRLDALDRIVEFVPAGPAAEGTWHFIGIQIAARSLFEPLPDGVPSETVRGLYRERLKTAPGSLRGWRLALPFVDVGTPADYLRAALSVGVRTRRGAIEDGAQVDRSATVLGSCVSRRDH
jgi:NDP-sugar pyrophosphorylase family protein